MMNKEDSGGFLKLNFQVNEIVKLVIFAIIYKCLKIYKLV